MLYQIKSSHTLTIERITRLTGLSSRTFRYWEKMGLLNPLKRKKCNAKREYIGGDVLLIQQILLLRRAGLFLKDIKKTISIDRGNNIKLLLEQNKNLKKEVDAILKISDTIANTIRGLKGLSTGKLTDYEMLNCFRIKDTKRVYNPLGGNGHKKMTLYS